MTKSDSKLRIRQVAIVLTCVDASTKQRLLGQLPADQARLVRQEIAKLGEIDPRERELAMRAFQTRSQVVADPPRPSPSNSYAPARAGVTVPNRSGYDDDSADWDDTESNPAAELIEHASSVSDEVDIDYRNEGFSSYSSDTNRKHPFEPMRSSQSDPSLSSLGLEGFPPSSGADIARLISDERPTVIATVVRQVSNALGAAILAALPSKVAALTLSTLPSLEEVDPLIMKDIHESLKEKLSAYRSQLSPEAPRVQHIQALLSFVPPSQRKLVERELMNENASLASSLGILQNISNSAEQPSSPLEAEESSTIGQENQVYQLEYSGDSNDSSLLTFEDLEDLPIESLAIIFRSIDPNTILISVSGAAVQMRARLESMIEPNNISRLRSKVDTFANIDSSSRSAARQEIANAANRLISEGKISPPQTAFRTMVA